MYVYRMHLKKAFIPFFESRPRLSLCFVVTVLLLLLLHLLLLALSPIYLLLVLMLLPIQKKTKKRAKTTEMRKWTFLRRIVSDSIRNRNSRTTTSSSNIAVSTMTATTTSNTKCFSPPWTQMKSPKQISCNT